MIDELTLDELLDYQAFFLFIEPPSNSWYQVGILSTILAKCFGGKSVEMKPEDFVPIVNKPEPEETITAEDLFAQLSQSKKLNQHH